MDLRKDKASDLFIKLIPKWKGKKTWDVIRSESYPATELKPGGNIND